MSKMKKRTMPKECKNDKEDSVENEKESVEKKKIKKRKKKINISTMSILFNLMRAGQYLKSDLNC